MKKFSGLGRGLGALIPQKPSAPAPLAASSVTEREGAFEIRVDDIMANPEQPRLVFSHGEIEDLMNSIKEHGILQPLVVTKRAGGGYELIAGERRFRASKMLGLESVPVVVRTADTHDKLLLALVENVQREDLNPLEEARAYDRLMAEFGMTQEDVARRVGKARSTVANTVRLLDLPQEIRDAISAGAVPAGSARAILSLGDDKSRLAFFRKMLAGRMSARDVERGVRQIAGGGRRDPAMLAAEERLRAVVGAKVEIKNRNGKGSIVVAFGSEEDLEEIMRRLGA